MLVLHLDHTVSQKKTDCHVQLIKILSINQSNNIEFVNNRYKVTIVQAIKDNTPTLITILMLNIHCSNNNIKIINYMTINDYYLDAKTPLVIPTSTSVILYSKSHHPQRLLTWNSRDGRWAIGWQAVVQACQPMVYRSHVIPASEKRYG